ncbi:hypothetical protein Tco_0028639, partial [Tanacetum coccineum]
LENTKTSQAVHITKLKERVKKLERRSNSRTPGLKRLRKVGRSAQVVSSKDEGLGAQGNAFKQGRKIFILMLLQRNLRLKRSKQPKPKAVTTAATTTTTAVTRPKARGVVVQELSEFTKVTTPSQLLQLPQAKDKVKAKMVEPEIPLKKKDQILIDEEIAQRLQEELQAKLEEEERLARQKEEDANIAEWDNVQAMIDADYELAARLQAQEQEELIIEEKSKLFVELVDKLKKCFARLRAEDQLKNKSFNEVQKAFDKTIGWIDSFVSMDSEVMKGGKEKDEGSVTKAEESSSKRAGTKLEQERIKNQKIDDDQEEAKMKKHMEIVVDEE